MLWKIAFAYVRANVKNNKQKSRWLYLMIFYVSYIFESALLLHILLLTHFLKFYPCFHIIQNLLQLFAATMIICTAICQSSLLHWICLPVFLKWQILVAKTCHTMHCWKVYLNDNLQNSCVSLKLTYKIFCLKYFDEYI